MAELLDLSRTGTNPQRFANQVSADEGILEELLNGISPATKKTVIGRTAATNLVAALELSGESSQK